MFSGSDGRQNSLLSLKRTKAYTVGSGLDNKSHVKDKTYM